MSGAPTTPVQGEVRGASVRLTNPAEACFIYDLGSFGKGSLSRSRPLIMAGRLRRENGLGAAAPEPEGPEEHLQLSALEAVYLSARLGVLELFEAPAAPAVLSGAASTESASLHAPARTSVSPAALLRRAAAAAPAPAFAGAADAHACGGVGVGPAWSAGQCAAQYAAYAWLRDRGLAPRCGLAFGCDLVVYSAQGPGRGHAPHCLLVAACDCPPCARALGAAAGSAGSGSPDQAALSPPAVAWAGLLCSARIAGSVQKRLLVATVSFALPSRADGGAEGASEASLHADGPLSAPRGACPCAQEGSWAEVPGFSGLLASVQCLEWSRWHLEAGLAGL